ncbi:MAG: thioredoxin domain-containing protein, partial [Armatimonadota bacterium]
SVVIFRSPESNTILLKDEVISSLVPEPRSVRNQLGPDDAPVTLVEYADLCCPQCREAFPKIHELIGKYPGRIRIVYRHFPIFNLPGHEMSTYAIIASEIAAQKGKFWQFADAFVAAQEAPRTQEGVNEIAQTVGVTAEEIVAASQDTASQPNKNLARDFKEALEIFDIKSTPTFMLYVKGQPVKKLLLMGMLAELETPEYQKLLKP